MLVSFREYREARTTKNREDLLIKAHALGFTRLNQRDIKIFLESSNILPVYKIDSEKSINGEYQLKLSVSRGEDTYEISFYKKGSLFPEKRFTEHELSVYIKENEQVTEDTLFYDMIEILKTEFFIGRHHGSFSVCDMLHKSVEECIEAMDRLSHDLKKFIKVKQ